MITLDEIMNGRAVSLGLGQDLEFRLPENRTTGYRWQLRPLESAVLQLEEDKFQAPERPFGAGGIRSLRFRAAQLGAAQIELDYQRPFGAQEPAEKFSVTIHVESTPAAEARG